MLVLLASPRCRLCHGEYLPDCIQNLKPYETSKYSPGQFSRYSVLTVQKCSETWYKSVFLFFFYNLLQQCFLYVAKFRCFIAYFENLL